MTVLDNYFSRLPTRTFLKGEIIFHRDDKPSYGYVVRQGAIKIYSIDNSGTERPLVFDVRNEMFPIGWIFEEINETQYFYEAFTDVILGQIDRQELIHQLRTNAELSYELYRYYVQRHLDLQLRVEALEQGRAQAKILHTLRFLCSRFGEKQSPNTIAVQLPLTQQDIANFVGLTRETTAIELKKLEKAKVISGHHGHYIVASDALARALETI